MKSRTSAALRRAWLVAFAVSLALASAGCGKSKTDTTPTEPGAPGSGPSEPSAARPALRADHPSGDYNTAQIDWQGYDAGLAQAASLGKPVCLVLSTSWCPHCRNFSKVFNDPRVVESARDFVMIHLDADANEEIARKFAPDGGYIPRTFFLTSSGQLDQSLHAPRDRYRFFYDESDPGSLLGGMSAALAKLHS